MKLRGRQFVSMPTAAVLGFSASVQATEPVLNTLGQAGGLVVPYAFTLPEGTGETQFNNYIDARYGKEATGSEVYWGAFGLLPYVEMSAGLANYPTLKPVQFAGEEHFLFRHLMANIKFEVPKFLKYQPRIAFGMTDIRGQPHSFRSKYGVISQAFGPMTLTAGHGQGDRLDGLLGGAEVSPIWTRNGKRTRLSQHLAIETFWEAIWNANDFCDAVCAG